MKKDLCIFILAAAAGLCAIPIAVWTVDSGKGNIMVTETVLEGSVEEAEGISVEVGTHWEGKLLWNTEYQPGHVQDAASKFDFSSQGTKWSYSNWEAWSSNFTYSGEVGDWRDRSTAYVKLGVVSTDFGTARAYNAAGNRTYFDVMIEDLPWSRLLKAAKEQTPAGETRTVTLRIRDYYDYYPLEFSVNNVSGFDSLDEYAKEFFKFPIPEDERLQIMICKDQAGEVLELNCHGTGEGYFPVTTSVYGDTGYYFSFYLQGKDKNFEEIQRKFGGQYAVYWLPLAGEGSKTPIVDMEQMKSAAQLPEGAIPVTMQLDRERQILYLLALQKEQYIMLTYSVDEGNLTLLQQLTVIDNAPAAADSAIGGAEDHLHFRKMTVQEDGILLTWQDNRFAFIAREGEEYRFWCTGVFPAAAKEQEEEALKAWLSAGGYLASESAFPYEHAFAFDGTRLALAAFENWASLDSRLLVYREGQLVYSGYYQYSGELDQALGTYDKIIPWGDSFSGRRRDATVLKPLHVSIKSQPGIEWPRRQQFSHGHCQGAFSCYLKWWFWQV